jgi:endonuclease IV
MIGVHTSKVSKVLDNPNKKRLTMLDAIIVDTSQLKLNAVQIYTHGPRNSKRNPMNYNDIREYCEKKKIALYVHSSYITTGIWYINEDTKDDAKSKFAIKLLLDQLESCDNLGSGGLVIHLPKKHPNVIVDAFKVLAPLTEEYKTPILLEMTAVKPHPMYTYETPEKNNRLCDMLIKEVPKFTNWGICPDTAHLWGAGIEIDKASVMKSWFADLKYPKLVKLIHLNGASNSTFATGKDKHMVIFSDEDDIWNDVINSESVYDIKKLKASSLYELLKFAKKHKLAMICEINRGDCDDIKFAIKSVSQILTISK